MNLDEIFSHLLRRDVVTHEEILFLQNGLS